MRSAPCRSADAPPALRGELLLRHAEALTNSGRGARAAVALDEALLLARQAGAARLVAGAALLRARHLDFNAPMMPSSRCCGRPRRPSGRVRRRCGPASWPA
jgi:hypothetical protein